MTFINFKSLHFLSNIIPVVFLTSCATFAFFRPEFIDNLKYLSVLQVNIQGASYAFIMSLFAYTVPGILICMYWWRIFSYKNSMKSESIIFGFTGILLVILGSLPYNNDFPIRLFFVVILSMIFNLANAIGFAIIYIKHKNEIKYVKYYWILIMYILYDTLYLFIKTDGSLSNSNTSTLVCIACYFTFNKLFIDIISLDRKQV
ncbi:hypothetical protein SAMN02746009_03755 [Hymenobacter psychrotolerans DSM 18569]|uniref:Uncharacterized protein n=1 Tax=Hymenobacter psychrotolerans DSM 18569 TaxID=1121959 RepID=A0A1M7F3R1_9BACT|nr:hypothetical protein SAMN02746009_03755 [Hymenobacter psychrotolerans DSM 18569]